jgi:hypothetical protein
LKGSDTLAGIDDNLDENRIHMIEEKEEDDNPEETAKRNRQRK